jgi:hypothetical protein
MVFSHSLDPKRTERSRVGFRHVRNRFENGRNERNDDERDVKAGFMLSARYLAQELHRRSDVAHRGGFDRCPALGQTINATSGSARSWIAACPA